MAELFSKGDRVRHTESGTLATVVRQHEDELVVDVDGIGRVYADTAHYERASESKYTEALPSEEFDFIRSVMAFEDGTLDEDGVIELFQYLVDMGLAWRFQGMYGRMAHDLIEAGKVTQAGE